MTRNTHASRRRDGIDNLLCDEVDNLLAPGLGRFGDRQSQFSKSAEVGNQQFILDIQLIAEILFISSITTKKLTSTRSEHLSSFFVKARNRAAYFACFGVPSIASLCALSNILLFFSSCPSRKEASLRVSRTTVFIGFYHCGQRLESSF